MIFSGLDQKICSACTLLLPLRVGDNSAHGVEQENIQAKFWYSSRLLLPGISKVLSQPGTMFPSLEIRCVAPLEDH